MPLRVALVALLLIVTAALGCRAHVAAAEPVGDATGCERELASPPFRALLSDLGEARNAPEVWPDYRLADSDLLLEWRGEDASCVAHWSAGEIVAVARASTPVASPMGPFGFVITDRARAPEAERFGFLTGDVPEPIVASLRERGARGALHWVVNTEEVAEGFPTDPATRRGVTHYLLHHESAHVHLMFLPMFGQGGPHGRPAWAVQPDKSELVARCYQAEPIRELFARERAAIADAVAAVESSDGALVAQHARDFTELRAQRHAVLSEVRVPSQRGTEVSCAEAEAVWELDEGGAEYVALATLSAIGIPLPADQRPSERIRSSTDNAPYYYTGAGQLLVLRHLLGDQMPEVLRAITTSTGAADGIHGQFKRVAATPPSR